MTDTPVPPRPMKQLLREASSAARVEELLGVARTYEFLSKKTMRAYERIAAARLEALRSGVSK